MATFQHAPSAAFSTVQPQRRLTAIRSGLLLASTCAAIVALLQLISGDNDIGYSLAARREILFAGLLVVQLAVIYQIKAFRQRS